jgi:hypothetical protein
MVENARRERSSAREESATMTTDLGRLGRATTRLGTAGPYPLDYYLIRPRTRTGAPADPVAAIVVEEFVLAEDCSAVALDTAGWSPEQGWWSSAAFSRSMRAEPDLRARVSPVGRDEAAVAFRRRGGGALPDEAAVRTYFRDRASLAASAPLRLSWSQDKRVYRILFAGELSPDGLANLRAAWHLSYPADPRARVVGTAELRIADHVVGWAVRRIGPGVAWCLDVSVDLGAAGHPALGPLLWGLTALMRRQGLIPVTIERFS